jgi:DNA polymerase-1
MDLLEIKALKSRIHDLAGPGLVSLPKKQKEKSDAEREVTEITGEQLAEKLLGRTQPIAIFALSPLLDGGFSVALSANECFTVLGLKGDWLNDAELPKYVHGAKNLLRHQTVAGIVFDTELAAYLINPGARNLELTDLAERFLEISVDMGTDDLFSQLNPILSGIIFSLVEVLQKEIKERELGSLLTDLELPSMFELARMEELGIAVDTEKLKELKSFFQKEVDRETKGAQQIAGREFNVGSPKQLQVVLFEELKLPKTKKIKTGFTTDAESLEFLFAKTAHPILSHLLRIRETSKLLTTVDGLLTAIKADGRIHTTFQQTVTATGRLSSTDPNLQNIPVRTEEGRRIRDCFVASSPFENLLTADYSQIEMRIMAHLSHDAQLITAFKSGEDLHSTVGSYVFGVDVGDVTPDMRRQIKAMSYGLAYGLSSYGLAQQLDLAPGQAQDLMSRYFERFGGIQDYLKQVVEEARIKGYTETMLGRRRYLPDLTSDNRQRREVAERMALNAPIQGSAADIIKIAMVNVAQSLQAHHMKSRLLLQVHDELILEIASEEEAQLTELVRRSMEGAIELSLPLAVNIGVGKSWDLAAH